MVFVPSPDQMLGYPTAFPDLDIERAMRDAWQDWSRPPENPARKLAGLMGMVGQTARGAAGLSPVTPLESAIAGVASKARRKRENAPQDEQTELDLAAQDAEAGTIGDAGARLKALASAVRKQKAKKSILR